jgi:hypothetical protein
MNMAGASKRKRQEEPENQSKLIHFGREVSELHDMEWDIPNFLTDELGSFTREFETGTSVSASPVKLIKNTKHTFWRFASTNTFIALNLKVPAKLQVETSVGNITRSR